MNVVALWIIPFWKKQLLMSVKEEMLYQMFVDTYHRLDNFISMLSPAEVEELEKATDDDEVYNKYANIEMRLMEMRLSKRQ